MTTAHPITGRMISIHLEDGVDSAELRDTDLSVSRRGMILKTRWHFSPGTQLVISIELNGDPMVNDSARTKVEGIVVDCQEETDDEGVYQTTVLFIDAPEYFQTLERSEVGALFAF